MPTDQQMTRFPRLRELMKVSVFLVPTGLYATFLLVACGHERWALGSLLFSGFWALAFPPSLTEKISSSKDGSDLPEPFWLRFLGGFGCVIVYFWLLDVASPEINSLWARVRETHALLDSRLLGGFALTWVWMIISGLRRHQRTTDLAIFQYYGKSNAVIEDAPSGEARG